MNHEYPSGWTVELATLDDLTNVQSILTDRCRWLAQRQIKQWPGGGFATQLIEKSIENDSVYLARVGKEVAGTFMLQDSNELWGEYPGAALYVRRMATHTSWGGRDIGGAMLSWIAKRAIDDARSFIRLDCVINDGGLMKYYEGNGFVQMAEVEIDGVLSVLMERPAQ